MALPKFLEMFLKPESLLGILGVGSELDAQNRLNRVAQGALGFDSETGQFNFKNSEMGDISRQMHNAAWFGEDQLKNMWLQGKGKGNEILGKFNRGNAVAMRRMNETQDDVSRMGSDAARNLALDSNATLSRFTQGGDALQSAFANRQNEVMGLLEGLGSSARRDIGEQFAMSGAQSQADLARRGLGTSTLSSGAARANTARQARAIQDLNENVRTQKASTLSALSSEALAARERQLTGAADIMSQNAGRAADLSTFNMSNFGSFGQQAAGMLEAAGLNRTNIMGQNLSRNEQNQLNFINQQQNRMSINPNMRLNAMNMALASLAPADVSGALANLGSTIGNIRQTEAIKSAQPSGFESFLQGGGGAGLGSAAAMGLGAAFAPMTGGFSMGLGLMSDINLKEDIKSYDGQKAVEAIDKMEVFRWKYRGEEVEHIGPMAQDWSSATGIPFDGMIHAVDANGVLLAAVKELIKDNAALRDRVAALEGV